MVDSHLIDQGLYDGVAHDEAFFRWSTLTSPAFHVLGWHDEDAETEFGDVYFTVPPQPADDFIAHASYRVTGNATSMGEAAGAVAAIAAKSQRLPHEVEWSEAVALLAKIRPA